MECSRADNELPSKMANLDIMEIDDTKPRIIEQEAPASTTRILRKRKSITPEPSKASNRRVCMKPRKHIQSDNSNLKQIEALYLSKKVKTGSQTLETIYEEPKTENNDSDTLIGARKIKRLITFPLGSQYTKEKLKKRRAKIKKFLGSKSFLNRKKIPMPVFLKTLECLDLDEAAQKETIISSSA